MRKYEQLKQTIINHIHDLTYRPGDRLPAESYFCETFNISRITVQKAKDIAGDPSAGQAPDAPEWVTARDAAVLTLLYGSGLRISEALGLNRKDAPAPGRDILRIKGKGGKERAVPVLPVGQQAVARYLELCPFALAPNGPLFSIVCTR